MADSIIQTCFLGAIAVALVVVAVGTMGIWVELVRARKAGARAVDRPDAQKFAVGMRDEDEKDEGSSCQ